MADEEKKPVSKARNSTGRLFWQSFIVEDFSIVKDYLIFDVLVPTIKDTIVEASCSAINLLFNGDTGKRSRSRSSRYERYDGYSPYSSIYKAKDSMKYKPEKRSYEEPFSTYRYNPRNAYMDLIFTDKGEAMDALDQLRDLLEAQDNENSVISVGDYYSIYQEITKEPLPAEVKSNWALRERWGWEAEDLSRVVVSGRRGEYYLTLPPAEPI